MQSLIITTIFVIMGIVLTGVIIGLGVFCFLLIKDSLSPDLKVREMAHRHAMALSGIYGTKNINIIHQGIF